MPLEILYMESIGGEAQFSGMHFTTGYHEEPSVKISSQLEAEYRNNPQIYGTKLDNGYLTVPYNREGAEAMAALQVASGRQAMTSVEREARHWNGKWVILWQK